MDIYGGQSKHHASNMALVFNPLTQLVSPQYHIIFYKYFETVESADPATMEVNINIISDQLFQDHKWIHCNNFTNPADPQLHQYFDVR
jgi:hypothetical protein